MTKCRWREMSLHSVNMALSAIEIYNKPSFSSREQVFAILMVNAWESLAKAKIVKDNKGKITSIYVKDSAKSGNRYKRNRNGDYLTIEGLTALERCCVSEIALETVKYLVTIRDEAIHFMNTKTGLPSLVFALGSASLQSYSRYLKEWFGISVSDYNFFILPLGFEYPFTRLSAIDLSKEPESIRRIIRSVVQAQGEDRANEDGHSLVLEVQVQLISTKKSDGPSDLKVAVVAEDQELTGFIDKSQVIDRYPFTYQEAFERIKRRVPVLKHSGYQDLIKKYGIKSNRMYSHPVFTSKSHEVKGPDKNTKFLYSSDFVAYAVAVLGAESS